MGSAAIRLADSEEALAVAGDSETDSDALNAASASAALASDPSSISVGAGGGFTGMTRFGMAHTQASVIRIIQAPDIRATQPRIAVRPIIPVQTRISRTATLSPPTTIWG